MSVLNRLVSSRTILELGNPYLTRHFLRRARPGKRSVFLHEIHRSDRDEHPHSHPWDASVSLIISGGYREERWTVDGPVAREFRPGSVNVIHAWDYHRITLLDESRPTRTLFVAGRRTGRSWGYLVDGVRVPWRVYHAARDGLDFVYCPDCLDGPAFDDAVVGRVDQDGCCVTCGRSAVYYPGQGWREIAEMLRD